jgi:hypothetical protein
LTLRERTAQDIGMTKIIPPVWQASEAQSRLPELVDAALDGAPQVVRRPDGREVVVMAREAVETEAPAAEEWKDGFRRWFLDNDLRLAEDDPFFTYLEEARDHLSATFDPSPGGEAFLDAVYPGHKRRKRPNKAAPKRVV